MRQSNQLRRLSGATLVALSVLAPGSSEATFLTMSGDLRTFLEGIPLPGSGSEGFQQPSSADIANWRSALNELMAQDYTTAAAIADGEGYDLVEFTDPGEDRVYYIFVEQTSGGQPLRGLGTYVYNPGGSRWLNIQAPHAGGDCSTWCQSDAMFQEVNAVNLMIAGTDRCSNADTTACGAGRNICTTNGFYPVSDVAHFVWNFFQPAHEEISTWHPAMVSVSVHGNGNGNYISNGTTGNRSPSLSTQLADEFDQLLVGTGLTANSAQRAGDTDSLSGNNNVQGRFTNGAADPCFSGVGSVTGVERFIHLEQMRELRRTPSGESCTQGNCPQQGPTSWQVAIDAFSAIFPSLPMGYLTQAESEATSESGDRFGHAVAVGDFNGDGRDDLAAGVPMENDQATDDGIVIVHYGASPGTQSPGFERLGQAHAGANPEAGDQFGYTLVAGDFNGDGKDDLAAGVPYEDDHAADDGMVIVFYGSASGLLPASYERLGQEAAGASSEAGDRFGSSLVVGDFNGNGYTDLAVGVPDEDDGATDDGMVVVFYGSASGLLPASYERLGQATAGATPENGDRFASTLAAGDFNNDGEDDLAAGVPNEDDAATDDGIVIVFYGSPSGLLPATYERLGQAAAGATPETGDRFGLSLAGGDWNDNGYDDLAVGVPDEDDVATNDGIVIVFYGSTSGLLPATYERLGQAAAGATPEAGDRFGASLASGDLNGNGRDDLAVGVPTENDDATDDGMVIVFYGSTGGLLPASYFRFGQKRIGGIHESGDEFGWSLAAGDFDADDQYELVVGVPFEDLAGAANSGAVYVWDRGFIQPPPPPTSSIGEWVEAPGNVRTALGPIVPNPFNPATTIRYTLASPAEITLRIYDSTGRFVRELASGPMEAGDHAIAWDGRNDRGQSLPSGVYHCRLTTEAEDQTAKLILLR
jgi:hypothetical protein